MSRSSTYYEPPAEWQAASLVARYQRMALSFHVREPRELHCATTHALVQARHALNEISLGIKSNDQACIVLAAEFLVSPTYFSGSGHLKAAIARRLKSAVLDEQTKQVLRVGIEALWSTGQYRVESREMSKLLRAIELQAATKLYVGNTQFYHPGIRARVAKLLVVRDAT